MMRVEMGTWREWMLWRCVARRYSDSWLPVPPRRTPLPRTAAPTSRYEVQSLYYSPRLPRPGTVNFKPNIYSQLYSPLYSVNSQDRVRMSFRRYATSSNTVLINFARVLSVATPDIETLMDIVKEILPNLADAGPKGNNEELDVRVLIHQSRAGCVIGKAGAKIKELREKTGARLKIFSNPAPQSTERVVQLIGKTEDCAAGIREVIEIIRPVPIKGSILNYDPHNYDDFYADEYGGFGSGQAGGRSGPRGPPRGPPRGMPPMGPGGPGGRGPPPRGPPLGRNGPPGPRGGFNDFSGPGPRGNFNGPPRGGFGGNFGGGNFSGSRGGNAPAPFGGDNSSQSDTTTQVTIPKDLAGAIIGKAGSRIRKIRAESGAGIEIAEPLPGSNDRIITITGTPQRIQMAQYLLQQSVHESNPNLGRGNF